MIWHGRRQALPTKAVLGVPEGYCGECHRERVFLQAFVENRDASGIMPWIVDVRDIGRAHVRAAEVCGHLFYSQCLHASTVCMQWTAHWRCVFLRYTVD